MGGDDFIPKPFDLTVLIAKIQAMLRRAYDFGGSLPVLEHRGLSRATMSTFVIFAYCYYIIRK